jgi:hypothetical protein
MEIDFSKIRQLGVEARKALDAYGKCVDAFLEGAGLQKPVAAPQTEKTNADSRV